MIVRDQLGQLLWGGGASMASTVLARVPPGPDIVADVVGIAPRPHQLVQGKWSIHEKRPSSSLYPLEKPERSTGVACIPAR